MAKRRSRDPAASSKPGETSVEAAAERVRQARETLRQAESELDAASCQAAKQVEEEQADDHDGSSVDDWLKATLKWVRRNPGPGVAGASLIGFLFGRWTSRL